MGNSSCKSDQVRADDVHDQKVSAPQSPISNEAALKEMNALLQEIEEIKKTHPSDSELDALVEQAKELKEQASAADEKEDSKKSKYSEDNVSAWFKHAALPFIREVVQSLRKHHSVGTSRMAYFIEPSDHETCATLTFQDPSYKIALIADAGTHDEHQESVLQAILQKRADIIIHLGDIYYAGNEAEMDEFWSYFPKVFQKQIPPVFSIPGNHEYLTNGGRAFFQRLLPRLGDQTRSHFKQTHSFFCLRFPGLQIIALDTGLKSTTLDHNPNIPSKTYLTEKQEKWLLAKLNQCKDPTILLSHHQPFSTLWNGQHSRLWEQFEPIFDANPHIIMWLWGHEHKLLIYNLKWGKHGARGRCFGNGGCAVHATANPYWSAPANNAYMPINVGTSPDGNCNLSFALLSLNPRPETLATIEYHRVPWTAEADSSNSVLLTDFIEGRSVRTVY